MIILEKIIEKVETYVSNITPLVEQEQYQHINDNSLVI
jgi:hypothetical protein